MRVSYENDVLKLKNYYKDLKWFISSTACMSHVVLVCMDLASHASIWVTSIIIVPANAFHLPKLLFTISHYSFTFNYSFTLSDVGSAYSFQKVEQLVISYVTL